MRSSLSRTLKKHDASNEVIEVLEDLPEKEYTNAAAVSKEFQGK
ncbi:DUF2795 domain-containing protein [Methanosarcina barkeri]